ncbi:MAG: endonuclease/exonuclease/phosphatase family protein [Planctomycetota bacterium]|nr:endonuclease/exonuclease/phosphatase family protein [Planctomycetota bacterium]
MTRTVLILIAVLCAAPLSSSGATGEDTLRVLVWNVLHGANDVDQGAEKALAIIRESKADLVLMQESYDIDGDRPKLGAWLAEQLGWKQWQGESAHLCVLTPLEMKATFFHDPWHGVGAELTDSKGRSFIAWSIWIDWRAYITEELRDKPDISDEELLAAEHVRSSRLQEAKAIVAHLDEVKHTAADIPVLVGGDWNTPSHLDWTVDTARIYKHRRALPLPVSLAMKEAGFVDTYRVVHPNPIQHPGITWSPMFRESEGKETGFERIDRLYLKNPTKPVGGWTLRPVAGKVFPETWEDDSIPVKNRAFPSDHGAVLMDLVWQHKASAAAKVDQVEPVDVKVLAFNILRSGNTPGPDSAGALYDQPRHAAIADVMLQSDPDIVLVQEEYGDDRVFSILQEHDASWHRRDGGSRGQATYARYPIQAIDQNTSRVMHPAGEIVVHNAHWKPSPYGPYILQDKLLEGKAIDINEILAESDKGEIYAATYQSVHPALVAGTPVIVGGDFNEPSHLDWTKAYALSGADRWMDNPTDTKLGFALPWKGSRLLTTPEAFREELAIEGQPMPVLKDTFRTMHIDEVAVPGNTWTPQYTTGTNGRGHWDASGFETPREAQRTTVLDRIDMIYTSGNLEPRSVLVLGDEGDPNTDVGFQEWPSDHRAVLATLRWIPAATD